MARLRRDWYLEGWSRERVEENGKTRTVWKYTGEYFRYDLTSKGLKLLKTAYAALTVLLLAMWFWLSMVRVASREFFFVGAEWFLCIIPFMELLLGVGCFLPVRERMTYRAMYGSYKRCVYGSRCLLVLLCLTVAGEVVFLALYGGRVYLPREIVWFLGVLGCLLCDLALVLLLGKYKPRLE